jgi:MFS family permease
MMPCVAALFASWVPRTERARAVTLTSVGGASGSVSAYYFAPWLAVIAGWRNAWRIFGWIGIGLAVAWFFLVKDSPNTPAASTEDDPAQPPGKVEIKSPLASLRNPMLRSGSALAAYVAHAGQSSAAYTLLLWLPTYLSRSFDLDLDEISIYLTVPKLVEMVISLYAGQFADGLLRRGFTSVQVRQLCTCVSLCISVILLVLLASARDLLFAGCCICVLFPCMSVCNAGFQAAYLDIGGKDSSLVLAFGNMLATLPGIVSPIYGAWVLEATGSWHCLFYSVATVQVLAAVFFYKKFGVVQRADFIKV